MDIYGGRREAMERVMRRVTGEIEAYGENCRAKGGEKPFEHLACRIKSEESMTEKLLRRGLEAIPKNAFREVKDAIGVRVVCRFINDVYETTEYLRNVPGCRVVQEKDYIRDAKENGYRSYHMILEVPDPAGEGEAPGVYFVEVQLRTIAMDTWAALEHEMKYKQNIPHPELITQELARCANELAACDVSMQALKNMIREL